MHNPINSNRKIQGKSHTGAIIAIACILLIFATSHWLRSHLNQPKSPDATDKTTPERIIALAPSVVEMLFDLGQGDKVVGVSRYTKYPPEATRLPKVGGMLDIDYEHIIQLRPDCVVMTASQHEAAKKFQQLGVRTVSLEHSSIEGIIRSFKTLGEICNKKKQGAEKTAKIRERISAIQRQTAGRKRPRVLISIERDPGSPRPIQLIAAGNKGFHQELIDIVGGQNAYQGNIAFPNISREKLIQLNPDIIIDLIRDETLEQHSEEELILQWNTLGEINAVKNKRIIIIGGNKHLIPGPRFTDTLERFHQAVQTPQS